MSRQRIVLAIADPELAGQAEVLAQEAGTLDVVGTAVDAEELTALLGRTEIDAVLVHEELGPLPVLELTRRLAAEHPTIGFLLLAREPNPDLLRQALRGGVRDVLQLPLTVETISESVEGAATWSRAVRDRMDAEDMRQVAERVGGRIIAVAGAKGGVGATTVAVHVALAAAGADSERTVCLVELDLQAGDLRSLLDVQSRRSIADLVAVASEVTQRSLDDTLYVHPSGLRLLLSPERGEDGEDVGGAAARGILAGLKFQYDLVICDVGAVMTEAGAVAVEMANDVLIVATPDVPALRAANRLIALWDRLRIRSDDAKIVLNRVSKEHEIQPDFARKVLAGPLLDTTIPAGFRDLEPALNTGAPDRLEQGAVHRALARVGQEIGTMPEAGRRRRLRLRAAPRAQTGQATVEALGMLPLLALFIFVLWQIVLIGYTDILASNSAREASRAWAVGEPCQPPAEKPLPKPWRDGMKAVQFDDGVRVTLKVPFVLPWMHSPLEISDRKRTLRENDAAVSLAPVSAEDEGKPCKD
ncbi:MAG TPA: AAA family ATPase [Solirubrobacteraceae bacterium]|jgi:pilus assembly protein CpaE